MDEERYNNRQIERLLDNQTADIKELMKSELAPILAQTTKTNGRVTVLEDKASRNAGQISLGAWIGIPLISIMVSVMGWMILQIIAIPFTVQHAVSEALLPYAK